MQFFVIGGVLVVWIAILGALAFNRAGKAPAKIQKMPANQYMLPVGFAVFVWMWIFALIFSV